MPECKTRKRKNHTEDLINLFKPIENNFDCIIGFENIVFVWRSVEAH